MEVKEGLSSVPGIGDLSGRKVQWGVMNILRGALGEHEVHDTITRRLQYFGISRAFERAESFIFNMALISSFVKPFILANLLRRFAMLIRLLVGFRKAALTLPVVLVVLRLGVIVCFTTPSAP